MGKQRRMGTGMEGGIPLLAQRPVTQIPDDRHGPAVMVPHQRAAVTDPAHASRLVVEAIFHHLLQRVLARQHFLHPLPALFRILRVHAGMQKGQTSLGALLHAESEHLLHRRADILKVHARQVQAIDRVLGIAQNGAEPFLTAPQFLVRFLPPGDVPHSRDDLVPALEHRSAQIDFDPEDSAVRPSRLPLEKLRIFFQRHAEPLPGLRPCVGRHVGTQCRRRQPLQVVPTDPKHLLRTPVNRFDSSRSQVVNKHCILQGIEDVTLQQRLVVIQ